MISGFSQIFGTIKWSRQSILIKQSGIQDPIISLIKLHFFLNEVLKAIYSNKAIKHSRSNYKPDQILIPLVGGVVTTNDQRADPGGYIQCTCTSPSPLPAYLSSTDCRDVHKTCINWHMNKYIVKLTWVPTCLVLLQRFDTSAVWMVPIRLTTWTRQSGAGFQLLWGWL